jgi:hypothetical protein
MKRFLFFSILMVVCVQLPLANSFRLIDRNKGAQLYYQGNEQVVQTALEMLVDDSGLICDDPFSITTTIKNRTIIVGIPGREKAFCDLLVANHIDFSDITGKWEAYKITVVKDGGNSYLFVMGSDPRGAAYGVLELSRQMGVTPWVWWADVVPERKADVTIMPDNKVYAPSVQYRGIFLNDEDWGLMPWSTRTFEPTAQSGAIGPKTYARIFELLLRLRANTIWPAMHECTVPFFFVDGNKEVAEKYGIVLSTSHAEPMMRTNTGEWDNGKYGDFNFLTNKQPVLSYWEERVRQLTDTENIYTIGMRGIHDGRMQGVSSLDDETKVLYNVIDAQRNLLEKYNPDKKIASIPQIFVPYKEVLKAYDNGLKLPADVTLVWCDDNHGYIMRLSNPEEQKRPGGAGVYYHVSYWGKPHDYLWLGSTQPGLIYTEMKRAWDNGAQRLWILNVGDIKPNEYLTEFFMDMAWDINAFSGNTIYAHQQNWLEKVFGNMATDSIDYIVRQYYKLASHRKPEHMAWNRVEDWLIRTEENTGGLQPVGDSELSPTAFGDEMERRIRAYKEIADLSKRIYEQDVPKHLKAAYSQLVHYPVTAAAAMNRKILYAQKSRIYADTNVELAAYYARLATNAYNELTALDYTYNKDMLNGKWELMMDMKPRDLPVFQEPVLPELPGNMLTRNYNPVIKRVPDLVETAGTPLEGDHMIALDACDFMNDIQPEIIESLGHSGQAVRLPVTRKIHHKQPHLMYKVNTMSYGDMKIKVGTIPMHPVHGNSEMRYAVVIDKQEPIIVSAKADFLSEEWAENVLRNQSLAVMNAHIAEPGEHIIRIYALDEELIFDQLMLEFDLERMHYLIPVKWKKQLTN